MGKPTLRDRPFSIKTYNGKSIQAIAQVKMKIQLLKQGQTDGKVFIQNAIVDTGFNGCFQSLPI